MCFREIFEFYFESSAKSSCRTKDDIDFRLYQINVPFGLQFFLGFHWHPLGLRFRYPKKSINKNMKRKSVKKSNFNRIGSEIKVNAQLIIKQQPEKKWRCIWSWKSLCRHHFDIRPMPFAICKPLINYDEELGTQNGCWIFYSI